MQGGAMGNLTKAKIDGVEKDFRSLAIEDKKLWAFNKEIGNYEKLLANVKKNDVVILNVWNDTRWPHSMHLHGHHFFVNSKEFTNYNNYLLRDTYLIPVSYTHLRAHETKANLVCRLLLEKKKREYRIA